MPAGCGSGEEAKAENTKRHFAIDSTEYLPPKEGYYMTDAITENAVKFLQKAMDTVDQHLADPEFDVNLFSQEMAMSRQQMHRKFRAVVDQSATEFIRVIRLKKAAELLSKKSGTVTEIGYEVGFNTPNYFTKTFKEHYGLTPSEYTEKYSGNQK